MKTYYTLLIKQGEEDMIGDRQQLPPTTTESGARKAAMNEAAHYGSRALVFCEFYRPSDSQHGYINRDGADITGTAY